MRLIDADELKEQLKQRYEKAVEWGSKDYFYIDKADGAAEAYLVAITTVNIAPTVDAVPVIRCKDCKWWSGIAGDGCSHPDCRNPIHCLPDEFCNCGERKEPE